MAMRDEGPDDERRPRDEGQGAPSRAAGAGPPEPTRFTMSVLDDACLLQIAGELDLSNAAEFEAQIGRAVERRSIVAIDLRACRYCDSAALSVLVRTRKALGNYLRVVIPESGQVRRIFDLAQLTQALGTCTTLADALAGKADGGSASA
jgi:anti-anti-sigma factor